MLLREDGDDQPLILQTKLILKETLMIVAYSACPALSKTRSLPMCGFMAQLVEQCTGNAEVTGFESR